jgi:hypothetical protein
MQIRHVQKNRDGGDFAKGSIRQIIYRRYSRGEIHVAELEM